jgi:hypothetical protein
MTYGTLFPEPQPPVPDEEVIEILQEVIARRG